MLKPGERLVVRSHSISRQRALLLLIVLAALSVFFLGFFVGGKTFQSEMVEKRQLADEVARLTSWRDNLEQRLVNAETTVEIDRISLEDMRKTLVSLRERLAEDEAELELYRNLMRDDTLPDGLLVRELVLTELPGSEVAYRLVVQQKTSSLRSIDVRVEVLVEGEMHGEKAVLSLDELDSNVSAMPLEMSFKYFDVRRGAMEIPKGFEPHVVKVSLWQKGKKSRKVQRIFGWREERVQ